MEIYEKGSIAKIEDMLNIAMKDLAEEEEYREDCQDTLNKQDEIDLAIAVDRVTTLEKVLKILKEEV